MNSFVSLENKSTEEENNKSRLDKTLYNKNHDIYGNYTNNSSRTLCCGSFFCCLSGLDELVDQGESDSRDFQIKEDHNDKNGESLIYLDDKLTSISLSDITLSESQSNLYLIQDVVDFPFEEPTTLEEEEKKEGDHHHNHHHHHPATPIRQEEKDPVFDNNHRHGDDGMLDNLPRSFPKILSETNLSYPTMSLGSSSDEKINETNDNPSFMSLVKQFLYSLISLSYFNCLM